VLAGNRKRPGFKSYRTTTRVKTFRDLCTLNNFVVSREPKHTDRVLSSNQQLFSYIPEKYSYSIFPKIYNTRDVTNNARQ